MLWPSEARSHTAPQAPTQAEAKSQLYLVQLLLRGFPQVGVNRTPKGLDQKIGIHDETLFTARIFKISEVYQFPGTAHMDAQLSGYPARKEAVKWSTRIEHRQICATRTSGGDIAVKAIPWEM